MFPLKGGYAVFVLAMETMAVMVAWGLVSPNPTNAGNKHMLFVAMTDAASGLPLGSLGGPVSVAVRLLLLLSLS